MNKAPINNPITPIIRHGAIGELSEVANYPLVRIKYPTKTVNPLMANYPKTVNIAPIPPTTENLAKFLINNPKASIADGQKSVPFKATIV